MFVWFVWKLVICGRDAVLRYVVWYVYEECFMMICCYVLFVVVILFVVVVVLVLFLNGWLVFEEVNCCIFEVMVIEIVFVVCMVYCDVVGFWCFLVFDIIFVNGKMLL